MWIASAYCAAQPRLQEQGRCQATLTLPSLLLRTPHTGVTPSKRKRRNKILKWMPQTMRLRGCDAERRTELSKTKENAQRQVISVLGGTVRNVDAGKRLSIRPQGSEKQTIFDQGKLRYWRSGSEKEQRYGNTIVLLVVVVATMQCCALCTR